VRRKNAFAASGPHECDAPDDIVGRLAGRVPDRGRDAHRGQGPGEVVRSTIALRLADGGDDRPRFDLTDVDESNEPADVSRVGHAEPVDGHAHGISLIVLQAHAKSSRTPREWGLAARQ
jgi:hypothetical protein